jgi:hypothetical protein
VVGTGTGATGWLASLSAGRRASPTLPAPDEAALAWFVREAWPSRATGATLTAGTLGAAEPLTVVCESERLVIFADGVEADRLDVGWGQQLTVAVADRRLHLVVDRAVPASPG